MKALALQEIKQTFYQQLRRSSAKFAPKANIRPLLTFLPYVLRYRQHVIMACFALIASAIMMLVLPIAVRRMIDNGFVAGNVDTIAQYFLGMIAVGALLSLASATRFYLVNWLGERVVADLRADIFRHLTTLGPAYFDTIHSGEIMSRLTADTTQIKSAAGTAISQAVRSSIMVVGALIMMFVTSAKLSLMVLLAIPLIIIPLIGFGRSVRYLSRSAQDSLANASAYAAENLAAVRTMQAFGAEHPIASRFDRAVESAFEAARSRLISRAGLTALAMFLLISSIVVVLWIGAAMVIAGTMSGGQLSQFVLYAIFVGGALSQLSDVWGEVQQAAGASERLAELLAVQPQVKEAEKPRAIPIATSERGRVSFHNVSFVYPSQPDAFSLKDISFEAAAGQKIALVGPSGAGKSSIFNLLLRFYDPTDGRIEIDGIDISQARLSDVRARMALVPQDIAIFDDTVDENIRYGMTNCTPEAIVQAAQIAQAHDFISKMGNGYNTRLGERGVILSGGQRQRLAIARAVLRDPAILLLDEATSALDAQSENAIRAALEKAMQGRTTIIITHRLATAQTADKIIVFDSGRIVGQGSHDELIREGGLYQRFVELQLA
ncbi:MAG: ABC transporter transmembrane domain-containing protein [Pseudomonadota bacterium]